VLAQEDKKLVFTISGQRLQRREIMTGIEGEEFMEVTSGLQPGERVVIGIKTETAEGGKGLHFGQDTIPDDIFKLEDGQSVVVIQ